MTGWAIVHVQAILVAATLAACAAGAVVGELLYRRDHRGGGEP